MLICGPTVYDFSHLGHARILLFYDLVVKYFMSSGKRATAILNITDIDPKISLRAKEEGSSAADISNRFIKELMIDIQSLGINTLCIARTSDYVETAKKLILELLDKKRAYFSNGNIYLDTSSLVSYGKLSQMSREDLVNSRVDIAPGKKNPNDILLWNGIDDFGQKYYDKSLGVGVPWWHMQDASVAMLIFNGLYDIHGGATELSISASRVTFGTTAGVDIQSTTSQDLESRRISKHQRQKNVQILWQHHKNKGSDKKI